MLSCVAKQRLEARVKFCGRDAIACGCAPRRLSMHRRKILSALVALIVAVFAITATPLFANPDFELGPPVNAKVPDIGTPKDFTGTPRTLASLMGDKGLVLFFFRSADWCPFCQAQMMD